MKIHIPQVDKIAGPQIFCNRLAKELQNRDSVKLTSLKEAEVVLHNILIEEYNPFAINVLRLDGVYFSTHENWRLLNKPLKESYEVADAIIFQSYFSKQLCEKYLGVCPKPYAIIHNGAEPKDFEMEIDPDFNQKRPFFLAVARWRPFKRLKETIEGFIQAGLKNHDLIIFGSISKSGLTEEEITRYKSYPNIKFFGKVDPYALRKYYAHCRAFIHLSWIDSCPNSVIEAVCAQKPVICGNFGGTPEIIRGATGVILKCEDTEYNLEPKNLYNPPAIDLENYSNTLKRVNWETDFGKIDSSKFTIQHCADQYLVTFKGLINERKSI